MLDLKQEYQVQLMLDDLTNLRICARTIESQHSKGHDRVNGEENMAEAVESVRLTFIEKAKGLAKSFDSKEIEMMASRYDKPYHYSPETLSQYLNELGDDMAELYAKGYKLVLENIRKRERIEQVVKTAEQSNELERQRHEASTREAERTSENSVSMMQMQARRNQQQIPNSSNRFEFSVDSPVARRARHIKKPSKLVYVKSSEQKEREKQAELKKQMAQSQGQFGKNQMSKSSQMTRIAPAMTAPQMGR